ncbi:hypothetical protein Pmani_039786 [Petrolisthes manimaculis]|uniref:Uncharacterized protein n=1 Tax=Petrolisthes manimaculis TaxID=1843537 RepID=A0AAE1TJ81_9EUCA|nr:hypothetical protein Pmani_039786 [Petrolisthes manimaculis]
MRVAGVAMSFYRGSKEAEKRINGAKNKRRLQENYPEILTSLAYACLACLAGNRFTGAAWATLAWVPLLKRYHFYRVTTFMGLLFL